MNWEDVLKRDDIVGGELETREDGDIYRGPIKSIELKDGVVDINLEWCATTPSPGGTSSGNWTAYHILVFSFSAEFKPRELSDNRVMVSVPGLGVWIIFPKEGNKLDPAKVAGLQVQDKLPNIRAERRKILQMEEVGGSSYNSLQAPGILIVQLITDTEEVRAAVLKIIDNKLSSDRVCFEKYEGGIRACKE